MDKQTKQILIIAAIALVLIFGLSLLDGLRIPILSDQEKEQIINEMLKTEKGREQLAKAIVEPIRVKVEWETRHDIQPLRVRGKFD